jgi:hypothetical protein
MVTHGKSSSYVLCALLKMGMIPTLSMFYFKINEERDCNVQMLTIYRFLESKGNDVAASYENSRMQFLSLYKHMKLLVKDQYHP